jgi:hypothetical protein
MYGAEKNVDGALEEKEMGSLVENYVWKKNSRFSKR